MASGGSLKRLLSKAGLRVKNGDQDRSAAVADAIAPLEEDDVLSDAESHMMVRVLRLKDRVVREIMIARPDIVAIPLQTPPGEVISLISRSRHSRFPVFDGDLDNIVGLLYAKDILARWGDGDIELDSLLRPACVVPENKTLESMLATFKARRLHLAVISDEHGGTSGIVTLEDIIEEIFGEILDEYDGEEVQPDISAGGDGWLKVDPRLPANELEERLELTLPDGDFDTVAGLALFIAGDIPADGQVLAYDDFELRVDKADERKLIELSIRRSHAGGRG